MPDLKFCKRCQTDKPLSEFHRHRRRPDGLQLYCKPCQIRLAQDTRDPVLRNECIKQYHKRHPVQRRKQGRETMRRRADRTRVRPYRARLHLRIDGPEDDPK